MPITTLIVDDEPLARARIARLCAKEEFIEISGEARNGREAVEMLEKFKPDLVFLDVQMPGLDGFGVIEKLTNDVQPYIIFVTAFEEFALKAFNVKAIDYLLKPFSNDRFEEAVHHAYNRINKDRESYLYHQVKSLVDTIEEEKNSRNHSIEVREEGYTITLHDHEIYWAESQGNYVNLYLRNRFISHRTTLQKLMEEIPSLMQVHRSILINPDYIDNMSYGSQYKYNIKLKNKAMIQSGRGYKEELDEFLKEQKKN